MHFYKAFIQYSIKIICNKFKLIFKIIFKKKLGRLDFLIQLIIIFKIKFYMIMIDFNNIIINILVMETSSFFQKYIQI